MKRVTVVLPTIGRTEYLDISIESILKQSRKFDEIVIFDNSVKQNLKNISKFGNDETVKFICSGEHLNAIDSWNSAVKITNCEYVTIVGDDDILLPNYCENIHQLLQNSDVGILKAYNIDKNGILRDRLTYPNQNLLTGREFRNLRFFNKLSLFVPGIVFKKELFLSIGGFKDTQIDGFAYSDELLLSQLSALTNNIGMSKDFCWKYRIHFDQIGGVKNISNYVSRVINYIELYENSLKLVNIDEVYLDFTKQDYIDKVCRYGIKLYGTYSGKNENIFVFLLNLVRYFIFNKQVSQKIRFKIALSSIGSFINATNIGKQIKRVTFK